MPRTPPLTDADAKRRWVAARQVRWKKLPATFYECLDLPAKTTLFTLASEAKSAGLYSPKTSDRDAAYSIFRHILAIRKDRAKREEEANGTA